MKILIIDDESDIGFILGFELQAQGHQTTFFTSTSQAQLYLKTETPDAILCDLRMSGLSGLELFEWLKIQNMNIPFYLMTGEAKVDTSSILQSGVKEIIYKPQDFQKISRIFK